MAEYIDGAKVSLNGRYNVQYYLDGGSASLSMSKERTQPQPIPESAKTQSTGFILSVASDVIVNITGDPETNRVFINEIGK